MEIVVLVFIENKNKTSTLDSESGEKAIGFTAMRVFFYVVYVSDFIG